MAKMMLKRVGILSVAKWLTLLMFFFSVLSGLYQGVALLLFNKSNVRLALFYVIAAPIIWSLMSFITIVLGGFIYNTVAGSVGGVVLELENMEAELLPPPPPTGL